MHKPLPPFKWLRFEKHFIRQSRSYRRFYELHLEKDLLNDWVIVRVYGAVDSRQGKSEIEAFSDYSSAIHRFNELAQYRVAKRKYNLAH